MDDARAVRVRDAFGRLRRDVERARQRQGSAHQDRPDRFHEQQGNASQALQPAHHTIARDANHLVVVSAQEFRRLFCPSGVPRPSHAPERAFRKARRHEPNQRFGESYPALVFVL